MLFFSLSYLTVYSQNKQSAEQKEVIDCRTTLTKNLNLTNNKNTNAYTKGNELHLEIKYPITKIPGKTPKEQLEFTRKKTREQAILALKNISGFIEDPQNACKLELYFFHVTIPAKDTNQVQHNYSMSRSAFNDLSGNFSNENLTFALTYIKDSKQ